MKRIVILFFVFVFLAGGEGTSAQGQFSSLISKMENSLFGINYDSQSDELRLKRIEEVVYGTTSTKALPLRVQKLKNDLGVDFIGQKIKPAKDTFAEDDSIEKEDVVKADSNVNYPIVNMLESEVFQKEYKTTEINKRLSNLEQKTFKRIYSDDLNSRVERLKAAVMPDNRVGDSSSSYDSDDFISQNQSSPDDYFNSPGYNKNSSVLDELPSTSGIQVPLSALEKSVLKKSFPDDPTSNRLSRLEAKVFNTSFVQDDEEVRLDRLSSAYRAKKSSKKYDSNKMSQKMSTAVQIGAMLLMVLAFVL